MERTDIAGYPHRLSSSIATFAPKSRAIYRFGIGTSLTNQVLNLLSLGGGGTSCRNQQKLGGIAPHTTTAAITPF